MPVIFIYIGIMLLIKIHAALPPKVTKIIIISVISIAAVFAGSSLVNRAVNGTNSNPFNYARVIDMEYTAVIRDDPVSQWFHIARGDGNAYITQRITYDIRQSRNAEGIWELWIALPETEWAYDTEIFGLKREYRVNSVKQILDDGTEIMYEESPVLYWDWIDYLGTYESEHLGPGKWYHSKGPYNGYDRFECILFYVDNLRNGQITFEVEYEMTNAALRYRDSSELYLIFAYEDLVMHLDSFKAQILIPDEIMPGDGNYDVYTYGTAAHYLPYTKSTTEFPGYTAFIIDLDKSDLRFRPYNRYLEFSLVSHGNDMHIFTQNAMHTVYNSKNMLHLTKAAQDEYEALPGNWLIVKLAVFALCLLLAFIILKYSFKIDDRMNKQYKFYKPAADIPFFRDIPRDIDSNFAAVLVFCKHKSAEDAIDKDGYAAVMLCLVRKGYIELERINISKGWDFNNMKLVVKHRPASYSPQYVPQYAQQPDGTVLEPLTEVEDLYFNLILRHSYGTEISLVNFQNRIKSDYGYTTSFVENVRYRVTQKGLAEGYYQTKDFNKPFRDVKAVCIFYYIMGLILLMLNCLTYYTRLDFAFGAFFILGLGFIISGLYMRKHAFKYHLLTQFGEDEYAKWRGLYNFLNSNTLMNERTLIDLPLWEKYLIYATEFGISDKVIKALKVHSINMNMNVNNSALLRNPYYSSPAFRVSCRTFRSATRAAASRSASAARMSSMSSGGGGYGSTGGGG